MIWIIVIVLVAGVLLLRIKQKADTCTIDEVRAAIQDGGLLLDVRTHVEYQAGHAQGARNMPVQSLQSGSLVGGDKSKPIYVYCHSGARAGLAKSLLRKQGYERVINVGSLRRWKQLGGTVI